MNETERPGRDSEHFLRDTVLAQMSGTLVP